MSYWVDLTGANLSPNNVRVRGMYREGVEREGSSSPSYYNTLGGRISSGLVFLLSRCKLKSLNLLFTPLL